MKLFIMSVFDSALNAFGGPFGTPAVGVAARSFRDEVNRAEGENQYYRHPDDYTLYCFGVFDTDTGKFDLHDVPDSILRGKDAAIRNSELN